MSGSDSRVMACATEGPHASQGVWGCSGSHCLLRDYSQISPFLGEEGKCKFWLEICHCECDPSLSSVCGLQLEWDTAPRGLPLPPVGIRRLRMTFQGQPAYQWIPCSTWSWVPVISGILLALQFINVTFGSDVIPCFVPAVCGWV